MTRAIQTIGLSHSYSATAGVWDLDLEVPAGSIYAFLGPNGAGKTTTIRLLLGLLRATRGQVLIDGIARTGDAHAVPHIGSMVEGPSLYPHLTGRENLRITALLLGCARPQVDEALRTVGLLDAGDRLVKQYSLGMRQRLGLAMALLGEPRLLVLDEPSNGLDPPGMADMRELMRELVRGKGMTIFLSSHLLDDVEKIATHVGLLHQGRLLAQAGRRVAQAGAALLVDAPDTDAAVINRELVLAGIDVHVLGSQHDSLERFFALATREARAA